jgi:hypothetical protein
MTMIVRLTHRDLAAVRYWGTARHISFIESNSTKVGKRYVDVGMPYSAWLALRNTLREQAFSRSGRGRPSKLTGDMAGTRHALTHIQRELNAMDVHPALLGELILGCSDLHIPVWPDRFDGPPPNWSLVPTHEDVMHVLVPIYDSSIVTVGGVTWTPKEGITSWRARPSIDYEVPGLFLDEADHRDWL